MREHLLIGILATFTLASCTAATSTPSTTSPVTQTKPAKTFTKADYDNIKTGMTVAQVEKATGFQPKEATRSEIEMMGNKIETITYLIANSDGSNAAFSTQGGKITSKMHMNLK
jgi:hypothetical protein